MIRLNDVRKTFSCGLSFARLFSPLEVEALSGLSFEHTVDECLWISGPSGSGKSVLLNLLGGYYPPNEGTVQIWGDDPWSSSSLRNRISLVRPSSGALDASISPARNLEVTAGYWNIPQDEWQSRTSDVLEFLELSAPLTEIPYGDLSPGVQNQVCLAAGLITSPDLLLLDEPSLQLDQGQTNRLADILNGLHSEGMAIVVASKDDTLIGNLPHKTLQLNDGRGELNE